MNLKERWVYMADIIMLRPERTKRRSLDGREPGSAEIVSLYSPSMPKPSISNKNTKLLDRSVGLENEFRHMDKESQLRELRILVMEGKPGKMRAVAEGRSRTTSKSIIPGNKKLLDIMDQDNRIIEISYCPLTNRIRICFAADELNQHNGEGIEESLKEICDHIDDAIRKRMSLKFRLRQD